MQRRLIVADENIPQVAHLFGALGEVRTVPGRTLSASQVRDADILLVRSVTPVNAALLGGSRVSWVGTATIGVDHLDQHYLRSQGIPFVNAPGSNATSVVEYVLSALAVLGDPLERLLAGDARIGIVGLGNVGGRLLERLQRLGIAAVACDPLRTPPPGGSLVTLADALQSEVVCLHTPLTHDGPAPTFHLIGSDELSALPSAAVLVNAGRGGVLDNAAALRQRPDLRLVLDVWEHEPRIDTALLARVALGTPHIAGYSLDGKLDGAHQLAVACCRHFGCEAPQLAPVEIGIPTVAPDATLAGAALIRQVLLGVYDPTADDNRLRAAMAAAGTDPVRAGVAFDELRRAYPVRRELTSARLVGEQRLSDQQRELLSPLGIGLSLL